MDPTAVIETYPNRKDSPIGLKKFLNYSKIKSDPKFKSKLKVRIEVSIENTKLFNNMRRPQNSFEPYPGCHNYPIWAPNDLDLGKKTKIRFKGSTENNFFGPKMTPNIKRKSNIRFGGKQENKSCFTISQNISSQKPNLKNSPFGQNKKKSKSNL